PARCPACGASCRATGAFATAGSTSRAGPSSAKPRASMPASSSTRSITSTASFTRDASATSPSSALPTCSFRAPIWPTTSRAGPLGRVVDLERLDEVLLELQHRARIRERLAGDEEDVLGAVAQRVDA